MLASFEYAKPIKVMYFSHTPFYMYDVQKLDK